MIMQKQLETRSPRRVKHAWMQPHFPAQAAKQHRISLHKNHCPTVRAQFKEKTLMQ